MMNDDLVSLELLLLRFIEHNFFQSTKSHHQESICSLFVFRD